MNKETDKPSVLHFVFNPNHMPKILYISQLCRLETWDILLSSAVTEYTNMGFI